MSQRKPKMSGCCGGRKLNLTKKVLTEQAAHKRWRLLELKAKKEAKERRGVNVAFFDNVAT